jgi:hypothetical protein
MGWRSDCSVTFPHRGLSSLPPSEKPISLLTILKNHYNDQDALDDYAPYKAGAPAPGAAEKVVALRGLFNRSGTASPVTPEIPPTPSMEKTTPFATRRKSIPRSNMKIRIKYISPGSLALTLAIIYFFVGGIIGIFGALAAATGSNFTMSGPVTFSGSGPGMLPLAIAYPFLASLAGAIGGFLIAWVYNFAAEFTKGIVIETERVDD